jgi:hypothetical protein
MDPVLFHILRGRVRYQDPRRCHNHSWAGRSDGVDGGGSSLICL